MSSGASNKSKSTIATDDYAAQSTANSSMVGTTTSTAIVVISPTGALTPAEKDPIKIDLGDVEHFKRVRRKALDKTKPLAMIATKKLDQTEIELIKK